MSGQLVLFNYLFLLAFSYFLIRHAPCEQQYPNYKSNPIAFHIRIICLEISKLNEIQHCPVFIANALSNLLHV